VHNQLNSKCQIALISKSKDWFFVGEMLGYRIGLWLYHLGIRIASLFHGKARQWLRGRRHWRSQLRAVSHREASWIWMHAASLGEFEQGLPVLEAINKDYPHYRILVSFFSPSGYEIRKDHPIADHVTYLPMDYPSAARDFFDILTPQLAIFVKYELWLNYLREMHHRQIPAILISASVKPDSRFFTSPLASHYRTAFQRFRAVFTQDADSVKLLEQFASPLQVIPSSDTRYDRVLATREGAERLEEVEAFIAGRPCWVAGSTWPEDEKAILQVYEEIREKENFCLVIAPHEIHPARIGRHMARFPQESLRLSEGIDSSGRHRILWVDSIGLLARIYRYATLAYIGGALQRKGLHNTLEAVAFGAPVLFGPGHQGRPEAKALLASGGAREISDSQSLQKEVLQLLREDELRKQLAQQNREFVNDRAGASAQIRDWCAAKGLISKE
jgi:3-deoxy-D-manno-octulosonic-acid transferase